MTKTIAAVVLIALVLALIFSQGKEFGANKEIAKQQIEQIQIQNEVIEEKKQVFQRQTKNKLVSISDDLSWLQDNICQDCKS